MKDYFSTIVIVNISCKLKGREEVTQGGLKIKGKGYIQKDKGSKLGKRAIMLTIQKVINIEKKKFYLKWILAVTRKEKNKTKQKQIQGVKPDIFYLYRLLGA